MWLALVATLALVLKLARTETLPLTSYAEALVFFVAGLAILLFARILSIRKNINFLLLYAAFLCIATSIAYAWHDWSCASMRCGTPIYGFWPALGDILKSPVTFHLR